MKVSLIPTTVISAKVEGKTLEAKQEAFSKISAIRDYLEPTERFPTVIYYHVGGTEGCYYWIVVRQEITEKKMFNINRLKPKAFTGEPEATLNTIPLLPRP
jgi:hypothetical protein